MDNADDYREKLTEARQNAAKCGRKGTEAALDAHWEVCCGDVLIAEENMQDQDREWENASLARDFLNIAYFLEGYDDRLDNLYIAIQRMRGTISNHPRLTIELLELEHTVIRRIEALCDHELDASEEVEAELAYYRQNVEYADKGRFDKIFFKGYLKRDPIEWSEKYEKIIDEANKKIYALLEDYPRGMGFCLAYWSVKEKVLREDYGVKWKSPVIMNPGVIFD